MGCSFSSRKASRSAMAVEKKKTNNPNPESGATQNREAPAMVEEESVKEVLSETPTPKPPPLTTAIAQLRRDILTHKQTLEKMKEEKVITKRLPINEAGEKYEISKNCSLRERLSREKMEENEDSRRKKINIPPGKLINDHTFSGVTETKKDWHVSKSPNRRRYQSPGRSYTGGGSIKIVQSRDSNLGQTMRGLRPDQQRRDHCEKSTRRSKSPATNRSDNGETRPAVGRSPSVRRGERSPSRSAASPPYAARKNRKEGDLKEKTRAANESSDNPLVSLECFIFL